MEQVITKVTAETDEAFREATNYLSPAYHVRSVNCDTRTLVIHGRLKVNEQIHLSFIGASVDPNELDQLYED